MSARLQLRSVRLNILTKELGFNSPSLSSVKTCWQSNTDAELSRTTPATQWRVSHTKALSRHASLTQTDTTFPSDLPVPDDDGACTHLLGTQLPSIALPTTSHTIVDLSTLGGLTILFCYPRTGGPNENIPAEWNLVPGARGCTPQACSFRDEIANQQEVKERVHLPYDLLSDEKLELVEKMKLPTFEWKGSNLIKRLALAVEDGKITKVWYPVFPPDRNARDVVEWLETRR